MSINPPTLNENDIWKILDFINPQTLSLQQGFILESKLNFYKIIARFTKCIRICDMVGKTIPRVPFNIDSEVDISYNFFPWDLESLFELKVGGYFNIYEKLPLPISQCFLGLSKNDKALSVYRAFLSIYLISKHFFLKNEFITCLTIRFMGTLTCMRIKIYNNGKTKLLQMIPIDNTIPVYDFLGKSYSTKNQIYGENNNKISLRQNHDLLIGTKEIFPIFDFLLEKNNIECTENFKKMILTGDGEVYQKNESSKLFTSKVNTGPGNRENKEEKNDVKEEVKVNVTVNNEDLTSFMEFRPEDLINIRIDHSRYDGVSEQEEDGDEDKNNFDSDDDGNDEFKSCKESDFGDETFISLGLFDEYEE